MFSEKLSFSQLIFWEAGDRGFDSRTKPQVFYASKSRGETKRSPFGFFFRHYATFFSKIIEIYQRVPPWVFRSFRFLKTFNEPKWPLLKFFGIVRLFLKKYFFWKKIQIFPIVVPWIFLSLRYGADFPSCSCFFWKHFLSIFGTLSAFAALSGALNYTVPSLFEGFSIISPHVHFTPYQFTPHSFHPRFISPQVHFTPRSFHPKFISPHIHFTPHLNYQMRLR